VRPTTTMSCPPAKDAKKRPARQDLLQLSERHQAAGDGQSAPQNFEAQRHHVTTAEFLRRRGRSNTRRRPTSVAAKAPKRVAERDTFAAWPSSAPTCRAGIQRRHRSTRPTRIPSKVTIRAFSKAARDADRHADGRELHAASRGLGPAEGAERYQEEEGRQEIGGPGSMYPSFGSRADSASNLAGIGALEHRQHPVGGSESRRPHWTMAQATAIVPRGGGEESVVGAGQHQRGGQARCQTWRWSAAISGVCAAGEEFG